MRRLIFKVLEDALRLRNKFNGVGTYSDPWKHFGPGGLQEAERLCERVNRDLLAYVRPPAGVEAANPQQTELLHSRRADVLTENLTFDSPITSGIPSNDRVQIRLWRPRNTDVPDRVVMFHHPVYQNAWGPWEWFLDPLIRRMPVALMSAPYHFDRTPPGWFPGEGTINPNPACLFEAIRQWFVDQRATHRLLHEQLGLRPMAVIGFSLGAFQSLLAASAGELDLPLVSIGSTNRYAYGLIHGELGEHVVGAMQQAGIDEEGLYRMVDSLQLERYVKNLHGHPVLFIAGTYDRVDPPPSGERLERALRPMRSLHLKAGHATLALFRRRIFHAVFRFFEEQGLL